MVFELRERIRHLETLNSKLVPDLERYELENYELKEQAQLLRDEIKHKDRECYNLQRSLAEAKSTIRLQEKVIVDAGVQ